MSMQYNGLSYFPLDANFYEEEVPELLEAKFGIQGSYIVTRLLCKIYKEGYYTSWGKEQCIIFLRKIGGEIEENTMNQIIDLMLEKGFFNKESYEQHGVLTSASIQKVWLEATIRRKHDFTQMPYLLIPTNDSKRGKCRHKEDTNEENEDNSSAQRELNPENADNSKQSKEKQSTVKEKKASSTEEEAENEEILLKVPDYAYNSATHNVKGLLECLERHKVTTPKETEAILRLSDYGRKDTLVWKLFSNTNWSKIAAPGKYIIASLAGSKPTLTYHLNERFTPSANKD